MKIDEKIEEMRSKLIKTVIEVNPHSKEEAIKLLEEFGLNNEFATKLLIAYRNAEDAKQTAKNVWNSAWNSKSGIDYSTDIAKTQQRETDTRTQFEAINAECALLIVANTTEPSEINDEILSKLFEEGIRENQISNPALKITFRYYCESRSKDIQRTQDLGKVREYSSNIGKKMTELQEKLERTESENRELRSSNKLLQEAHKNLQTKFRERIDADEKHYQTALIQIKMLKKQLKQLQERGIFKVIGEKLTGLFGNKTEKLPETTLEIPDTLFQSKSEEIGMQEFNDPEIFFMSRNNNDNHKDANKKETPGEVQEQ